MESIVDNWGTFVNRKNIWVDNVGQCVHLLFFWVVFFLNEYQIWNINNEEIEKNILKNKLKEKSIKFQFKEKKISEDLLIILLY